MTLIHGRVCWSELMTRDVPGAIDFYSDVADWAIAPMQTPEGPYYVCSDAHGPVAGMIDISGLSHLEGVAPHWFTYLGVADIDAAVADAAAAGGVVQRSPWHVPGVGRIAIVSDSSGAAVGLAEREADAQK